MLTEMEDAGIKTPNYYVFRNVTISDGQIRGVKHVNYMYPDRKPYYVFSGTHDDPWANYRYGDAFELSKETE